MAGRTIAIGDIHGDFDALQTLLAKLPELDAEDTLVFLGDYVDRGPHSAEVIDLIRHELPKRTKAQIKALRGNHEDGWIRVFDGGWPEFVIPANNGCLATYRSFVKKPFSEGDFMEPEEFAVMQNASFLPADVLAWLRDLPFWYEDEHAIYVHAGLIENEHGWLHPKDTPNPLYLLWVRTLRFFTEYNGKRVICGHTSTDNLPPELDGFTPEDPLDIWGRDKVFVIDTGCGKGGFLTALELPSLTVYESRVKPT